MHLSWHSAPVLFYAQCSSSICFRCQRRVITRLFRDSLELLVIHMLLIIIFVMKCLRLTETTLELAKNCISSLCYCCFLFNSCNSLDFVAETRHVIDLREKNTSMFYQMSLAKILDLLKSNILLFLYPELKRWHQCQEHHRNFCTLVVPSVAKS